MPKTKSAAATEASTEELLQAYRVAVRSRASEEYIVRLVNKGEVKFAIWGPGEEIHGTATALALSRFVGPENFGFIPHYRSGCLCSMWCELNGKDDFVWSLFRQQFSKDTDTMSRGRQMVYHLDMHEIGILPVQSPVGMQLGKAAGYAKGFQVKGEKGLAMGIIGDGTSAESDLHEAMNAASVWQLPVILMVTDNSVAISTTPEEGRGIVSFEKYAEGFGVRHFSCDGRDFWDTYETTLEATRYAFEEQKPVLFHVKHLPRFNGHSSAADVTFDLGQEDPLIKFGEALVERGLLESEDIMIRKEGEGRDFFSHHEPGRIMAEEIAMVKNVIDTVKTEPEADASRIYEHIYPPFPEVEEKPGEGTTNISYAGAIRAAVNNMITLHNGVTWGQDIGRLGGVMTATAGLKAKHPEKVIDAPLNEPLIIGTACGAGLHKDLLTLPEVQFGDYILNTLHWLVHMGNLHWATDGRSRFATIVRTPTDPFGGGAMYHSMSIDGLFTPIPGLVIVMPSTSWDVYGLLMTAAEFRNPVLCLEPKWMYRLNLGPAFPDEPTDADEIAKLKKSIMRGEVPDIDPAHRVPIGKAATRRHGDDVTIVAWGRAVWTAMDAAKTLAETGVEAEVIDLRTLVPPDLEAVEASVARTGRLVVAAEDRSFAGFVRSIQGHAVEKFPGLPTRAIGQKNIPGVGQSPVLEKATVLNAGDIVRGCQEVIDEKVGSGPSGFSWLPPSFYTA